MVRLLRNFTIAQQDLKHLALVDRDDPHGTRADLSSGSSHLRWLGVS